MSNRAKLSQPQVINKWATLTKQMLRRQNHAGARASINLRRLTNKMLEKYNQSQTVNKWKLAASMVIQIVKDDKTKTEMGEIKGKYKEYRL